MYYKKVKQSDYFKKNLALFYEKDFPYPLKRTYFDYDEDIDSEFDNWEKNQTLKTADRLTLEKLIVCYEVMIEYEYGIFTLYSAKPNDVTNIKVKEHFDFLKETMSFFTLLCTEIQNSEIEKLFNNSDFETYEYRKADFLALFSRCVEIASEV